MTFSLIVPVYNVEKYLSKCLDSILNQSFQDFEIIVVNDGSPDNSQEIIDEYVKNHPDKIKAFVKENGGLSDARNFGIERASGDYLLFVDSDDYLSLELLCRLKKVIDSDKSDVVRFSAQIIFENLNLGEIFASPVMNEVTGEDAIFALIDNKQMFEPACFYAYKRQYWKEKGFVFANGRYHEDFGLIPEVIMKAEKFSVIDYIGYYYVQSSYSIMRNSDYAKTVKKASDILYHVIKLKNIAENSNLRLNVLEKFLSYLANAAIVQVHNLQNSEKYNYLNKLRREKIFDLLLEDNLKRKIKKICIKIKYGAYK